MLAFELIVAAMLSLTIALIVLIAQSSVPGLLAKRLGLGQRKLISSNSSSATLVTVVIPYYNERRHIRACLQSLRNQTYTNWQAIVVDDASSESSQKVLQKEVAGDPRFTVLRHENNSGLAAARNTGLDIVDSELVTFLDSDDCLFEKGLEQRIEQFEDPIDPDLAGFYCGVLEVPEHFSVESSIHPVPFEGGMVDFVSTQGQCPFSVHAPVIRTEVIRLVGGYNAELNEGAEDWDLWNRVLREGFYFLPVPHVGAIYRQKPESLIRDHALSHVRQAKRLLQEASLPYVPLVNKHSPFREPIQVLNTTKLAVERVISFGAMTYVIHGSERMQEVLGELPDTAGCYLLRHIDVDAVVSSGVTRAMNSDVKEVNRRRSEFEECVAHVSSYVREAFSACDEKRKNLASI